MGYVLGALALLLIFLGARNIIIEEDNFWGFLLIFFGLLLAGLAGLPRIWRR